MRDILAVAVGAEQQLFFFSAYADGVAVDQQVAAPCWLKFYANFGWTRAGQAKLDDPFPNMFAIKSDGMSGAPVTGLFFKIALGGG